MKTAALLPLLLALLLGCAGEAPPGSDASAADAAPLDALDAAPDAAQGVDAAPDLEPDALADAAPDGDAGDGQVNDAATHDAAPLDAAEVDVAPACGAMTPGDCCGVRCPATGAHAGRSVCSAGRCGFVCEAGFGDCDGDPSNGCEVDLATAFANCGACGNRCPAGAGGAGAVCRGGRCALACPVRSGDCNDDPADGCETNVDTNPRACGACGVTCSAPTGRCSAGNCAAGCSAGYALCADGCANTAIDRENCGGCGRRCAMGQACVMYRCV